MFRHTGGGLGFIFLVLSLAFAVFIAPLEAGENAVKISFGFAGIYPCSKVGLQSRISLKEFPGSPMGTSDIWGYFDLNDGREYAIIGLSNGTVFVDEADEFETRKNTRILSIKIMPPH